MFEKTLVPLLLTGVLGQVRGKTRFQKLLFLIQDEASKKNIEGLDLSFKLHLHGPYSAELQETLDDLVGRGYLNQTAQRTPSGYPMYLYRLTPRGKALLKDAGKKELLPRELVDLIHATAQQYGELPLPRLVDEAYDRL